jgi:hypothetical protein
MVTELKRGQGPTRAVRAIEEILKKDLALVTLICKM